MNDLNVIDRPLTIKELTVVTGYGRTKLSAVKKRMQQNGRPWPGGRATPSLIFNFFKQNPNFKVRDVY